MKIKKSKIYRKLLELYLIKLRTYEQYDKKIKNIVNISVNQTLIHFKKALRIIFKFHKKNKKILFLGFNGLILKKINKETNHTAISSKIKLQGIISNDLKFKNYEKYSLLKLKKKPNLIVIFDFIENHNSILKESSNAKIPTITFGSHMDRRNKNTFLYSIPTNIEFLVNNKFFFYNCLKFLFKKPIVSKPKKIPKYEKKKI